MSVKPLQPSRGACAHTPRMLHAHRRAAALAGRAGVALSDLGAAGVAVAARARGGGGRPEVLVGALLGGRQARAILGGRQARAVWRARQPRLVVRHLAALPRAQHRVALGLHLQTN